MVLARELSAIRHFRERNNDLSRDFPVVVDRKRYHDHAFAATRDKALSATEVNDYHGTPVLKIHLSLSLFLAIGRADYRPG